MRSLLLGAAVVLASAVGVQAADLIVEEAPVVADTSFVNSGIYFQLLGGVVQDLPVNYYENGSDDGDADTEFGYSFAATAGVVVLDGLSVEADVLYSTREYSYGDETYSTLSLMANAKYTVELNDTFSIYGAVGLGYVWGTDAWSGNSADYGSFGYQVIAGVGAKLTDNISAVAEYRFQDTFDKSNFEGSGDYGLSIPVSTVLAGLKFSF
ncbi:outer membrane protein [Devosia sp. CN2-171]|uniref:outer membrane protein n=1 Tax=Devosia sp. CN2-171 TaxID=3400909 RepID=UPI003BF8C3DE